MHPELNYIETYYSCTHNVYNYNDTTNTKNT